MILSFVILLIFQLQPKSQKNPNKALAIARHEIANRFSDGYSKDEWFIKKMNGHGYLVHRPDRLGEILQVCQENRLST